ncbi:PREDICTED: uncharacterized protein LOC104759893 [Camelina sativa]|uniref:Uncharacterized protein LOC104759893 n=1 Tax=Camelina sativa TaxID=90675 RepID=A0ABM0X5L0_CAMSA|nr:PREDICTED: uncharacterized protein LOC104759893 [Camelina sativa]
MLANCGMIDFPYKGNFLSWVGKRRNRKRVRCPLDRAVSNEDWHQNFSHTSVEYLKLWGSDHRPGFKNIVKAGWGELTIEGPGDVHSKIVACRKAISLSKRENPGNAQQNIKSIKEKLDQAQNNDSMILEEELELKWQLCAAFREEELYWKQKSRVTWLKEGDRNTKFFHATTKQRRARNRICSIMNKDGALVEMEDGIEYVATQYFQDLFFASSISGVEEVLRPVKTKVTLEVNDSLTRPPSNGEIKKLFLA